MGLLLRSGADETIADNFGATAASEVGAFGCDFDLDDFEDYESYVEYQEEVDEDIQAIRRLLARAPAERAWRRRGYLVLCRTRPDRLQQWGESSSVHMAWHGGCVGALSPQEQQGVVKVVQPEVA